jgi:hypothetical protein
LLIVLGVLVGWCLSEAPTPAVAPAASHGPEWRRTADGWIKVGSDGPAGLSSARPEPAKPPKVHPGMVAAFLLAAGLVSLLVFDRSEEE